MLPTQSAYLKIFVTPIISFFRAESKQDHTKNKPHPVQSNQHRVWLVYYYFFIAFKIEYIFCSDKYPEGIWLLFS